MALERLIFVKVAAVLILVVLGVSLAVDAASWRALGAGFASVGTFPDGLGVTLVFGAIAYAGSGGAQNLCQSNWIRDKGFGMGQYIPRLVSPITGAAEATSATATSYIFEPTAENMRRWRSWWRFANLEQALSFGLVTVVTIALMSLMAYATLFGQPGLPNDVSFLRLEAQQLRATRRPVVRRAVPGRRRLLAVRHGHGHHRLHQPPGRRRAEDDLRARARPRAGMYFRLVWGMVALGCADPAGRHVAADDAARHLGLDRRHDDVLLFLPADRAQSADAAGGDPHRPVPDARCWSGRRCCSERSPPSPFVPRCRRLFR